MIGWWIAYTLTCCIVSCTVTSLGADITEPRFWVCMGCTLLAFWCGRGTA